MPSDPVGGGGVRGPSSGADTSGVSLNRLQCGGGDGARWGRESPDPQPYSSLPCPNARYLK